MPWIQSDTTITRKPKFKKLIRRLEINLVEGVGYLHCFWHNIMELAEDGDISAWTEEDIAEYFNWKKDPKMLYKTLLDEKWIEKNGKLTLIHDWLDYAGGYLKLKYRTANPLKLKKIYVKHKTVLRLTLDTKQTAKIDKIRLDKIIYTYISAQGWEESIKDNPFLLTDIYKRHAKSAKQLLLAVNDDQKAIEAINQMAQTYKKKNLSWTLETVLKHLPELLKPKGESTKLTRPL